MPVARFCISAIGQQGIEPGALFAVELAIDCGEVPELGIDRRHPMFGERSNQFVLTKLRERGGAAKGQEGGGHARGGVRPARPTEAKAPKAGAENWILAGERLSAPPLRSPTTAGGRSEEHRRLRYYLLYAVLVRQLEVFFHVLVHRQLERAALEPLGIDRPDLPIAEQACDRVVDQLLVRTGREQGGLVEDIGQVGAGETGGAPRDAPR